MSSALQTEFGTLRSFLWPIYRHETKKIVPMIFILFFICSNYSIVRNMKDALVVTAAGAEVIPFIKVWVMLPSAVLLTLLYTKLCNRYSQENVFYIIVSLFLSGFALFTWVLYPNQEALSPTYSVIWLETILPPGAGGLISMYKNWTLTAFYVMSELWGSMVLSVLFWGFANEVTRLHEARRFYSVFPIWLNVSTITASQVSNFFTSGPVAVNTTWDISALVILLLISGFLAMVSFWWTNRYVFAGPEYDDLHSIRKKPEPKNKKSLSFKESMQVVSNSKYLVCIATIVVSYNLVINLVEVVWKDQLRHLYPSPSDYNTFMNNVMTVTAFLSSVMALLIPKILTRFGWTTCAGITPVVMLITSTGFFFFLFFNQSLDAFLYPLIGLSPLALAVYFGAAQNCLSKASKYSVFDATKEMAYLPLPHEVKLKGKAAIDGVGSRLGKSGGSLIHQSLYMILITLAASTPYIAAILMAAIVFWIISVKALGREFSSLVSSQEKELEPAKV
jgi:AAA family ATP:ADP antiporter